MLLKKCLGYKKIVIMFLLLLAVGVFTACGNSESEKQEKKEENEASVPFDYWKYLNEFDAGECYVVGAIYGRLECEFSNVTEKGCTISWASNGPYLNGELNGEEDFTFSYHYYENEKPENGGYILIDEAVVTTTETGLGGTWQNKINCYLVIEGINKYEGFAELEAVTTPGHHTSGDLAVKYGEKTEKFWNRESKELILDVKACEEAEWVPVLEQFIYDCSNEDWKAACDFVPDSLLEIMGMNREEMEEEMGWEFNYGFIPDTDYWAFKKAEIVEESEWFEESRDDFKQAGVTQFIRVYLLFSDEDKTIDRELKTINLFKINEEWICAPSFVGVQ